VGALVTVTEDLRGDGQVEGDDLRQRQHHHPVDALRDRHG
jgi:hypothetical protein